MRINKLFSNMGICSRNDTNKLIEERRIKVNGDFCVQGQWVTEEDDILLDNEPISNRKKIYLAFNKPVGIVCTTSKDIKNNIIDFINYPQYIFPVGRLDKESQGLILMTNDGDISNKILNSDSNHEKEYVVTLNKDFTNDFLDAMKAGVEISCKESSGVKRISDTVGIRKIEKDGVLIEKEELLVSINKKERKNIVKTRPCKVSRIDEKTFRIILTQGLNRQIRKMCSTLGYNVVKLERVRIMNIKINDLKEGFFREITNDEISYLRNILG
ncbi:MAG: pseudouridine synthase [Clostridium butyricum]|nr:pseudouridine synthase [Clostridium butyricum]